MIGNPIHILLLVGGALSFLITFFVITILRHHRRYVRLQQERTRNEIIILEKERKRIAYDLHDELGPLLSAIKMNLNSLDIQNQEDQAVIEKAGQRIDDIVRNMRSISYDLLPVTLQRRGLIEAIREMATSPDTVKQLQVQLSVLQSPNIDKEEEVHVFRIVQEIMHNTIRHAKARQLHITISREKQRLVLVMQDDGIGFDPGKLSKQKGGLGLKSIESRAQILNSRMLLETAPGRGCFYYFSF